MLPRSDLDNVEGKDRRVDEENAKLKPTTCGIHFGATRCCCCVYHDSDDGFELNNTSTNTIQKYEIIPNEFGELTSGCVLSFVGEDVDFPQIGNNFVTRPLAKHSIDDIVMDLKKIIGRKFSDPVLQNNSRFYPFNVVEGPNDEPYINVKSRMDMFAPELLTSFIFKYITQAMLPLSGYDCSERGTVLSTPCYFTETQNQALREACEFNGVPVLDIVRDSECACLAYNLEKSCFNEYVLTFGLGGSALLVCVEYINERGEIELKGFDGDSFLGGDDFDNTLVKYACEEFLKTHSQYKIPARSLRTLKYECEKAKIDLSLTENTSIHIKSLITEPSIDFSIDISRKLFEDLNATLFNTCVDTIQQLLSDLKLGKSQISKIVLLGGSCNIPKVKELLSAYFNIPSCSPESSNTSCQNTALLDSIPPEHVIAVGAAKKASMLHNTRKQSAIPLPTFVDINPISIGIEVYGNYMTNILERNCYIPCTSSIMITPCCKNQDKISLKFLAGERLLSKDNITLFQTDLQCQDGSDNKSGKENKESTRTFKIECEVNISYQLLIRVYEWRKDEVNTQCSTTLKVSHTIDNYSQILSQEDIFSMIKQASLTQSQDVLALRMIHSMVVPSLIENPNSTACRRLPNTSIR
ncbi:hypothetical protein C9374_003905 [Naegleria lovaniensis]|uniref:Heat shock protein 70 n=1 Tax=Naegleria lovaniensis TaxID=51637 RepID=A0AA88H5U3_NAELO|nr:uncharacterized protein C9374_003905 [Naegleria lovaniensis]KAG2394141.1 hypothetical protein C9374_003905 [Naegleria lovaniensis]